MPKEEKANKYAVENIDSEQSIFKGLSTQYQDDIFDAVENAYSAGYTQAEQDLSSQLTACKEVLRELVEDIEESKIDWKLGHTFMYRTLITPEILTKAKTLIE